MEILKFSVLPYFLMQSNVFRAIQSCQAEKFPSPLKVDIADSSHKLTTSLAMEIISEPFDLLGFFTNERKILCFKPRPVTGTPGLGPEVMTDGEGLSPQLPLYPLREQAKDVEAKYRRLFLTLA